VWNWEHERKKQVKLIKNICLYPPTISKTRRGFKKRIGGSSKAKLDMERRYATAGPNKQMYDMYNMSMHDSGEAQLIPGG
jgi:hypothetical protein